MKVLTVFPERCTSCQICELYCSLKHFNVMNPARSRISVVRSLNTPVVCIQCHLCLDSCPLGLISLDNKTGAVIINEDECTGCGICLDVCPYGAITIDPIRKKALVCDLCGGDPECVKRCPENALDYLDSDKAAPFNKLAFAKIIRSK